MIRTILGVSGPTYTRVVPALFAYLFNRIDMEMFIAYVDDTDRKEGTRLKDIARFNGYLLKNCKLYAYACHCARLNGEDLPKPSAYGVTSRDATLLRKLNLKHIDTKLYRAFTLAEFDATVDTMLASSEIRNYIGRFVTKKMSFLMKSYGEKRDDIEAYLKETAIVAVYKQYPRYESYLHFVNVAKAQIHNKGHSFITSSTAKSRQKLVLTGDGQFDAVHVPLDTLSSVAAPPVHGVELKEQLQALATLESVLPERTQQFLLCAAGQYHAGFSAFLNWANDEAADAMEYDKYMLKVQMYFDVTPESTKKLYQNLRTRMMRCTIPSTAPAPEP